jgi:NADH dehydrogenase (ubiquinone) 1 beta subcomplex subunit 3
MIEACPDVCRIRLASLRNSTGFDPKALAAASGRPSNDPWARKLVNHRLWNVLTASSEAWRYNGPFTRFNRFRGSFPGLGIATVAFAAYCTYEYFFLSDHHAGDGHGHTDGRH